MTVGVLAAIVGGAVVVLGLLATAIALRSRAAGAQRGAQLQITGEQPGLITWLNPVLDSVAGGEGWTYETYDLRGPDEPPQLRVELRNPTRDASITLGVDSSHREGTFTASDPINLLVRLTSAPPPTGLSGALFGQWSQPATRTWRTLVQRLRAQSKPLPQIPAAQPPPGKPPETNKKRWKLSAVLAIVAIVALATVGYLATSGRLAGLTPPAGGGAHSSSHRPSGKSTSKPTSKPTFKPTLVIKGKKPTSAKACPRTFSSALTPAHSAADARTTSCPFAENVRSAYLTSGKRGKNVTLKHVYSPKTGMEYDMKCQGKHTVTCKGGIKAVVYLY
jgi:hypothetical protein